VFAAFVIAKTFSPYIWLSNAKIDTYFGPDLRQWNGQISIEVPANNALVQSVYVLGVVPNSLNKQIPVSILQLGNCAESIGVTVVPN
jgi:hypothetical protein